MHLFKSNLTFYLFHFLAFFLVICACGVDEAHKDENKMAVIGSYHPTLIFPADISREESTNNAITGINCQKDQISFIEFTFIVNGNTHGPFVFVCQDHEAYIEGIPAGTGIRVDVYACDENHSKILYGFETTTIHAGQVTEGGEIEMKPVDENQQDEDGDGFTPPNDCDDTNADINPDATEIPDNNVDENCDGQVESPLSFILDYLNMQFVRIPAGEFDMGSPEDELGRSDYENLHRVRLTQSFYLQTTEVTQGQWRMVVNTADDTTLDPDPSFFTHCGDGCPVERVSWSDIQLFIDALNTRYENSYEFFLPTEAQWEYAARGESNDAFANGSITVTDCGVDPVLYAIGWYCGNSDADYMGCRELDNGRCIGPHPVGEKSPNALGLFDMHGNVMEWCQDYYDRYPNTTEPVLIDPSGPSHGTMRVNRGGSWYTPAAYCRSAHRNASLVDEQYTNIGFRLVCSPISN